MLEVQKQKYRGKLHFPVNLSGTVHMLRAGCLVIRDSKNNCYGVKERWCEGGKSNIIGFCGGVCEIFDKNIVMTILREFYEECVLRDQILNHSEHYEQWILLLSQALNNPQTQIEYILNYIYNDIIYQSLDSYLFGKDLKVYYVQCVMPDNYIQFLCDNYNLYRIPLKSLRIFAREKIYKANHRNNPIIIVNDIPHYLRAREYGLISNSFIQFLERKNVNIINI